MKKKNDYQRANGYLSNRNDINEETFVYVYCLSYHSSTSNFAIRAVKVEPVEAMPHSGNSIRNTYLGNIILNNDIRKVNLNDVLKV